MTGPQRILEKEKRFSTLPIDIQDVTHSFQVTTSLDLSEDIADLLGEIIVSANIAIREKRVTKTIKNIPVLVNATAKNINYSLDPKFITVKADVPLSKSGDKKKLATMFTAKLKLDNLLPGTHTIPVDVIAEKGVQVSSIQPETIVVEIQNIPASPPQERNSKGP